MRTFLRTHCPIFVSAVLILGLLAAGPIAQAAHYHAFADARTLLGLPRGADVLSNLGFLLAGLHGLSLPGRRDPAYATLCAALIATAFGSAWYHLAPDDARLVWDRIPIAVACAAVLARACRRWLAPLAAGAVASVLWWHWSGDLRPYLLFQMLPLAVVPLLQWRQGSPGCERRRFGAAALLYLLAKLFELADQRMFDALGAVSGHTLKHLAATVAALVLVRLWGRETT